MADFEVLIKQALKTQNSTDDNVRQKVYQSSRNALLRMLQKTGNHETPAGKSHMAELEQAIARLEADYTPLPENPLSENFLPANTLQENTNPIAPSPVAPVESAIYTEPQSVLPHEVDPRAVEPNVEGSQNNYIDLDDPSVTGENLVSNNQAPQIDVQYEVPIEASSVIDQQQLENVQSEYAQPKNVQSEYDHPEYDESIMPPNDPEPVLNYKRKSPIFRRLSGLLIFLIVIGVIAWLAYAFFTNLSKPTDGAAQQKLQEHQKTDQSSIYLDILTPSDSSALVTSGRGTAEVVTQLNVDYLRIQSIRTSPNSLTSAEPILLELQPGVLSKIAGKSVTVEIRTKSGNSEDGLFSVQCLVSGESVCDRKRFPVGQQPENIIFALKLDKEAVDGGTFLAINTDVKSTVNTSGAGSPIDILYVRIRIAK
ncbi:MAG: hypothetical protein COC00_013460 [Rhizobiales bacterium]|nr:hypothetical protein [Hyphomicrobiales bacterium]